MLNSVLAQKRGVYFKVISECIKKICFNGRDSVTGGMSSFNYDSRTVLLNNGYYCLFWGLVHGLFLMKKRQILFIMR